MAASANTRQQKELAAIIREIVREEINAAFELQLKPMKESLAVLIAKVDTYSTRVDDLEIAANAAEVRLHELEKVKAAFEKEINFLKQKTDALDNQSRKLNVRVIGLEAGVEAGNPISFMSKLFYELFGLEKLGPEPLINIAHRTGPQRNGSRCMIVRLFSFEVKRRIVRLAAELGRSLIYAGKRVSIYPDLSAEIVKQRATYDEVRSQLRKLKLRCGFIHPAKLILTFQNNTHIFSTAKEAQDFFENNIKPGL